MEKIHSQGIGKFVLFENFLKMVFEIVFSALNGCRLDDLILAYACMEYPKIGFPILYGFPILAYAS